MLRRTIRATLLIYLTWAGLELVYGLALRPLMAATPELWRHPQDLKLLLGQSVILVGAVVFVLIYVVLVDRKTMRTSLEYGVLFGVMTGLGVGYGTYAVMPVSSTLAAALLVAKMVKMTAGGAVLGLVFGRRSAAT